MMELIWSYRILSAAVLFLAFHKGEEPERLVAGILLTATIADFINHALFGDPAFFALNPGHLVIDSWTMIALLWVALRANRGWPMWACAAQLILMVAHVAKLTELSLVRFGYFAMTQLPVIIQTVALLTGTIAHIRRTERLGRYHAWRLT